MLTNNFSDSLFRDIVPNCIYLQGTGKIVSVVIFFFTNKVVARVSHACRINAGSNTDYLFSSCFESIEICFRLPAHGSGCRCFLLSWLLIMNTGKGKTPTVTLLRRAPWQCYKQAETSANPPSTTGSCLPPLLLHGSAILKPQLQEQQPFTKPLVADKTFQEQTLAPGSRDIASPKGLSKFTQLNYVSLAGIGNTRRGSKTLQRRIMELVRSNAASMQAPFKDGKCHQFDQLGLPLAG